MAKTLFIAPIYNYYPILVHSLAMQTVADWQLLLLHDGPNSTGLEELLRQLNDPRIRYYETDQRFDDWGHSLRALAMERIGEEQIQCDFIVITNADNYYCPGFIEHMCNAFDSSSVAVYCPMVHNHYHWRTIDSRLEYKRIDCGCVMVRREAALAVGWTSREYAADWVYVSHLIEQFGSHRFKRIDNVLFVHN